LRVKHDQQSYQRILNLKWFKNGINPYKCVFDLENPWEKPIGFIE